MSTLLRLENLTKQYKRNSKGLFAENDYFTAVDHINLEINRGDIFGLIGESGSGKSTTAKLIMRIIDSTSGNIIFNGKDISGLSHKEMFSYYRKMQMIFQDCGSSFNPRGAVGKQIIKPMLRLGAVDSVHEAEREVYRLFERVGLKREHINRYPHEFSGGQRQRLGIARALALKPEFLVLDEPTSALDVSIQAQILNLLLDLQEEFKLTYLFIGHNLNVVEFFCNRVAVMYKGKIVEAANSKDLYEKPFHPVSEMLFNSVLTLDVNQQDNIIDFDRNHLHESQKSTGCIFSDKCLYAKSECFKSHPEMQMDGERKFACYYPLN